MEEQEKRVRQIGTQLFCWISQASSLGSFWHRLTTRFSFRSCYSNKDQEVEEVEQEEEQEEQQEEEVVQQGEEEVRQEEDVEEAEEEAA